MFEFDDGVHLMLVSHWTEIFICQKFWLLISFKLKNMQCSRWLLMKRWPVKLISTTVTEWEHIINTLFYLITNLNDKSVYCAISALKKINIFVATYQRPCREVSGAVILPNVIYCLFSLLTMILSLWQAELNYCNSRWNVNKRKLCQWLHLSIMWSFSSSQMRVSFLVYL